jgi:adenylate kinase
MKLAITGSPGVGKTSVSKALGKELGIQTINEKAFALKKGIEEFDEESNELVVPVEKLGKEINKELKKEKDVILEGHLLCEAKIDVDAIILIRVHPEILELRLEGRGYAPEKIMDNVFCEGIDYCKKHLLKNYKMKKIIEVESKKSIKETKDTIIKELCLRKLLQVGK